MHSRPTNQKGFSLIELLIVVTIILIIAAIAIPNLMRSKIQANEAAAVETLRTLTTSGVMYSTTYGGYPHAISDMGPITGTANATSAAADPIDSALASGVKGGYKFTNTVGSTDPGGYVLSYPPCMLESSSHRNVGMAGVQNWQLGGKPALPPPEPLPYTRAINSLMAPSPGKALWKPIRICNAALQQL